MFFVCVSRGNLVQCDSAANLDINDIGTWILFVWSKIQLTVLISDGNQICIQSRTGEPDKGSQLQVEWQLVLEIGLTQLYFRSGNNTLGLIFFFLTIGTVIGSLGKKAKIIFFGKFWKQFSSRLFTLSLSARILLSFGGDFSRHGWQLLLRLQRKTFISTSWLIA